MSGPSGTPSDSRHALEQGEKQAHEVLRRRARRAASYAGMAGPSRGLLLAEGDSWFDYPFFDTLEELEDRFNYTVSSVAHKGDTVEEMAYDANQLEKLARELQKLNAEGRSIKAILLSGGGNDIAGDEFSVLLNHKRSALPTLSESMITGLIDERLRAAITTLVGAISTLCREIVGSTIPILMHGYDYAVPDGRGYLGGFWKLPGPWLEPGFRKKGYGDADRAANLEVMVTLIDRFNVLLSTLQGSRGLEHLHHVDLRGTLPNELANETYKEWWGDELHPTERGFGAVAGRFHQALSGL